MQKLWFYTIKPRKNPCGFKAIRNCGAKQSDNIIKGAQARGQSCVVYLCQGENTYDFLIYVKTFEADIYKTVNFKD